MAENKPVPSKKAERRQPDLGQLMALGLAFGLLLGLLFDNIAVGITLGILGASIANAYEERKEGARGAGLALAIGLLSLGIVVIILALSW